MTGDVSERTSVGPGDIEVTIQSIWAVGCFATFSTNSSTKSRVNSAHGGTNQEVRRAQRLRQARHIRLVRHDGQQA